MSNAVTKAQAESKKYLEPMEVASVNQLDRTLADTPFALVLVAKNTCPFCKEFYPTWDEIGRRFHRKLVTVSEQLDKDPVHSPPIVVTLKGEKNIADIAEAFGIESMTVPFIFFHRNGDNYLYSRSAKWMSLDNFAQVYPGARILEDTHDPQQGVVYVQDINGRRYPTEYRPDLQAIQNPFVGEENDRSIESILTSFARFTNKPELVPRPTNLGKKLNDQGAAHAFIGAELPDFIPGLHVPPSKELILSEDLNEALVGQLAMQPSKYRPHLFFIDINTHTTVPATPPCILEDMDHDASPQHCQRDALNWFLQKEEEGWDGE